MPPSPSSASPPGPLACVVRGRGCCALPSRRAADPSLAQMGASPCGALASRVARCAGCSRRATGHDVASRAARAAPPADRRAQCVTAAGSIRLYSCTAVTLAPTLGLPGHRLVRRGSAGPRAAAPRCAPPPPPAPSCRPSSCQNGCAAPPCLWALASSSQTTRRAVQALERRDLRSGRLDCRRRRRTPRATSRGQGRRSRRAARHARSCHRGYVHLLEELKHLAVPLDQSPGPWQTLPRPPCRRRNGRRPRCLPSISLLLAIDRRRLCPRLHDASPSAAAARCGCSVFGGWARPARAAVEGCTGAGFDGAAGSASYMPGSSMYASTDWKALRSSSSCSPTHAASCACEHLGEARGGGELEPALEMPSSASRRSSCRTGSPVRSDQPRPPAATLSCPYRARPPSGACARW